MSKKGERDPKRASPSRYLLETVPHTAQADSGYLTPDDKAYYRAELQYNLHREMREMYDLQHAAHGLTYKKIADRLGVNPSVVTMRFKGASNLTIDALSDTFRAMGARLDCKAVRLEDLERGAIQAAADLERGVVTILLSHPQNGSFHELLKLELGDVNFEAAGSALTLWSELSDDLRWPPTLDLEPFATTDDSFCAFTCTYDGNDEDEGDNCHDRALEASNLS